MLKKALGNLYKREYFKPDIKPIYIFVREVPPIGKWTNKGVQKSVQILDGNLREKNAPRLSSKQFKKKISKIKQHGFYRILEDSSKIR